MMDEIQTVCMSFESGSQGTMAVVPLGNYQYRLAATPLVLFDIEDVYWGDIVEAEFHEDGCLYFRKIVERALLRHKEYILSHEVEESVAFASLLEEIEECGGGFEIVMGGGFRCHLPQDCSLDVDDRLAKIYKGVFAKDEKTDKKITRMRKSNNWKN